MGDPRDKESVWWQIVGERAREHRLWWRRGRQGAGRIVVDGENLRAAKLTGLSGLRLVGCDLGNATLLGELTHLELVRCSLDNVLVDADLTSADLLECTSFTSSWRDTRLFRARLEGCALGRSDLVRLDLTRAAVKETDFGLSDLTDATLSSASFRRCSFRDARLVGTRRAGPFGATERTRFVRCDFRGVDWQGRRLRGVIFDRCAFHGGRGVPVFEGPCQIVAPDFSAAADGTDIGTAERLIKEWRS